VRAELHLEIGAIHNALGDNAQARLHRDQAVQLFEGLGQGLTARALEAQFQPFELLKEDHPFDAARAAATRLQARAAQAYGPANQWALAVLDNLAHTLVRDTPDDEVSSLQRLTLAALAPAAQLGTGLAGQAENPAYADVWQARARARALAHCASGPLGGQAGSCRPGPPNLWRATKHTLANPASISPQRPGSDTAATVPVKFKVSMFCCWPTPSAMSSLKASTYWAA
jgi:hypothetical protein